MPGGKVLFDRVVPAFLSLLFAGAALAQPADTVAWSAQPVAPGKGGKATLILTGKVSPGWHVYGLKQAAEGPTPLLVTLDQGVATGPVSGDAPIKFHDPAFGLDTQYYEHDFALRVPVRLKADAAQMPVSVRFQTCNGRTCQPPTTVRLNAPVTRTAP
jgi:hypothetical protein